MILSTLAHDPHSGWTSPPDGSLDSETTLILAFGGAELEQRPTPLAELRAALPRASFVGCSTAGEIFGTKVSDGSLAAAVIRFDHCSARTASAPVPSMGASFSAGEQVARSLFSPDLKGVLILSDGLGVNGSELVRGVNGVLPKHVTVTGGLAADGDRFRRTWVVDDGRPVTGRIVAVGFYGERLRFGHGSKGGWDIFGPERTVTRARGNVLYELDGRPALQLYKEYLGERAAGLPATALLFPLALRAHANDPKQLVRTVLAVNEPDQSMTFAGDIPEGALAQLMRANFDRLVQGASDAALMTGTGDASLAIAISCVGRRLVLGPRIEEEVEATLDALPAGTSQIGFYSYGEISPYVGGTGCDLHNQTMTLTTISEA
jgi:hypothetical protein